MATNPTASDTLMEDAVWEHRHVRSGSFNSVGFNNPRLLLCYRGGGGAQSRRQRQFGYQTTADRKALRQKMKSPDSDEQRCRAIRVFQTPNGGHGGGRLKIWASGSPSQMTRSLPKSHGGGTSLQRLSGSPAQKRMKGINEVASENAVPPATSLKAHLHLFPPSHEAKLGPTWPKYHLEHLSLPFGPHRRVQCKCQYKSKLQ